MADETIDIPEVAMGVILNAGDGRVCIDQAMSCLAELNVEGAEEFLKQAEEKVLAAHRIQTSMIQRDAAGEHVEPTILLIHAQDTLMTIAAELHMAKKMLPVIKALLAKN